MSEKFREYWIHKGDSCFANELVYSFDLKKDVKHTPDAFYDLISPKDTIEKATHVIEYSAYEAEKAKVKRLVEALQFINKAPVYDCECTMDLNDERNVCPGCMCDSVITQALKEVGEL